MKLVNTITNTEPLILHAYGASHFGKGWDDLCIEAMSNIVSIPEDVTVISFFFGDKRFALKEQLSISNIPVIDATKGVELFTWQDRFKIKMIADCIKNVTTKYVLILDGVDVLLGSDINKIVEKFNSLDCKLLYNACAISHPLSQNRYELEDTSLGVFNKLNTGAFIGETKFVELFYNDLMTIYDDVNMPVPQTDGIRVGLKYKNYPEIKIDYNCDIFQTLLQVDFDLNDGILTVKKTN